MKDHMYEGTTPTARMPTSKILELLCDGIELMPGWEADMPGMSQGEAEWCVYERLKIELTARGLEGTL